MAGKYLALFVIASVTTQGFSVPQGRNIVEITLPDEFITHISNPLIGRGISIPKSFLDTLQGCYVVYPNGQMYEAFPTNQIPSGGAISHETGVEPFNECSIDFLGADASLSGAYELISLVQHNVENYTSRTRKVFHMSFIPSDLWSK